MATWADVVIVAPELATIPSASGDAILAIAQSQVSAAAWGNLANAGVIYLAAHLGTLSRRGAGGPVTSEKVGALSRTYAPLISRTGFALTAYGMEYERLMGLVAPSVAVI